MVNSNPNVTKMPGPSNGRPLATPKFQWFSLHALAGEDQAAKIDLTADDLRWSDDIASVDNANSYNATTAENNNGIIDIHQLYGDSANGVEIAFFGTDENAGGNATAGVDIVAYTGGPQDFSVGKMVYSADDTVLLGTRVCNNNPISGAAITADDGFWADTITGTDYWDVTIRNSGNNEIAIMSFDLRGYRFIRMVTYELDGTGEVESLGAILRAF